MIPIANHQKHLASPRSRTIIEANKDSQKFSSNSLFKHFYEEVDDCENIFQDHILPLFPNEKQYELLSLKINKQNETRLNDKDEYVFQINKKQRSILRIDLPIQKAFCQLESSTPELRLQIFLSPEKHSSLKDAYKHINHRLRLALNLKFDDLAEILVLQGAKVFPKNHPINSNLFLTPLEKENIQRLVLEEGANINTIVGFSTNPPAESNEPPKFFETTLLFLVASFSDPMDLDHLQFLINLGADPFLVSSLDNKPILDSQSCKLNLSEAIQNKSLILL